MSLASVAALLRPIFWGTVLNALGLGVILAQSAEYLMSDEGRRNTKLVVIVVAMLVFNLFETALNMAAGWRLFVQNFGNMAQADASSVPLLLHLAAETLIQVPFQIYYAQKALNAGAPRWTMIPIALAGVATFIGGIGASAQSLALHLQPSQIVGFRTWAVVWRVGSFACDVMISGLLLWKINRLETLRNTPISFGEQVSTLRKLKQESGLQSTLTYLVNLVSIIVVETSVVPALYVMAFFIYYMVEPNSPVNWGLGLIFPKVLAITCLASINAFRDFESFAHKDVGNSTSHSASQGGTISKSGNVGNQSTDAIPLGAIGLASTTNDPEAQAHKLSLGKPRGADGESTASGDEKASMGWSHDIERVTHHGQ